MKKHDSMRGHFFYGLHSAMKKNKRIWVITGDLGYKMLDDIKDDYPDRFINCGAAEQAMVGVGVGLANEGKIPFVYSITPFLLYRPYETIRTYINHEKIPVKLIGGGRDRDYSHDGFSHWSTDDKRVMRIWANIQSYWPETKEEAEELVDDAIHNGLPTYVNLRR